MEVFQPGSLREGREQKGKIRISSFFGIDASMGQLIEGQKPDVNDLLRFAKDKGT
jgi:hypothetical protein